MALPKKGQRGPPIQRAGDKTHVVPRISQNAGAQNIFASLKFTPSPSFSSRPSSFLPAVSGSYLSSCLREIALSPKSNADSSGRERGAAASRLCSAEMTALRAAVDADARAEGRKKGFRRELMMEKARRPVEGGGDQQVLLPVRVIEMFRTEGLSQEHCRARHVSQWRKGGMEGLKKGLLVTVCHTGSASIGCHRQHHPLISSESGSRSKLPWVD